MTVQAADGCEGQNGEICHVYPGPGRCQRASCQSVDQVLGIVSGSTIVAVIVRGVGIKYLSTVLSGPIFRITVF